MKKETKAKVATKEDEEEEEEEDSYFIFFITTLRKIWLFNYYIYIKEKEISYILRG